MSNDSKNEERVSGIILEHFAQSITVCVHGHHVTFKSSDVLDGEVNPTATPSHVTPCVCYLNQPKPVLVPKAILREHAHEA